MTFVHQRVKEEGLARMDVSGPASIMKLVQTEQEVAKYELLMQLMGQRGTVQLAKANWQERGLAVWTWYLETFKTGIAIAMENTIS